jgi:hypothetical protein
MPWTITSANIADDWSERCGVDFSTVRESQTTPEPEIVRLV